MSALSVEATFHPTMRGGHVGDERDVSEPGPRRDIGHVRDPEPAGRVGGEPPLHEIFRLLVRRVGLRGEDLLRPFHPVNPRDAHQPAGLIPTDDPALPDWLHFYNHHRRHSAIGAAPISRLNNLPGLSTALENWTVAALEK